MRTRSKPPNTLRASVDVRRDTPAGAYVRIFGVPFVPGIANACLAGFSRDDRPRSHASFPVSRFAAPPPHPFPLLFFPLPPPPLSRRPPPREKRSVRSARWSISGVWRSRSSSARAPIWCVTYDRDRAYHDTISRDISNEKENLIRFNLKD